MANGEVRPSKCLGSLQGTECGYKTSGLLSIEDLNLSEIKANRSSLWITEINAFIFCFS